MSISPLRIVFAGTPEFASVALAALIEKKYNIVAVYTQPDRPAGRGLKLKQSPVKELALQHQLPIYQPASLKEIHEQDELTNLNADVMVVAAYGLLLPAAVLRIPRLGCINIHPSLLPRWRGAAPIQRAIFAGDSITGVCIMQMDVGLDTGPILLKRESIIALDETSQSLHDKLASLGGAALIEALDLLAQQKLTATPQEKEGATYANKISKEEALIDWTRPAIELDREIRAFNPWPVAYTSWKGQSLRIWQAQVVASDHQAKPRAIVHASNDGIDIATGQGVLRLLQVQLPGGKKCSCADFYHARQHDLIPGEQFI